MSGFLVNPGGTVQTGDIDDGAVTTAKIAAGAVTTVKIASGVIADQTARDMAASALAYTLAQNDATSITGSIGRFYLSDDFETDSLATKTNATFVSGYYHNPGAIGSDIVPALTSNTADPNFLYNYTGGASEEAYRVFDNNEATNCSMTMVSGLFLGYNFGVNKKVGQYEIRVVNNASGQGNHTPQAWTFQGWNGASWVVLDTVSGVTSWANGERKTYTVDTPANYTQYRLVFTASNNSAFQLSEIDFKEQLTPVNITLAPTPVTLATANPTDLIAFVVIDPQEAITAGTDIIMTMSIDGGTTDATGTWTKVGDIGVEELYRVEADVSAQTGSSLTYEITTANSKEIRYHDCVGIMAIY